MIAPPAKTAATRREGDLPPRERILAAARALFYRRGIHVVGVETIASAHAGDPKAQLLAWLRHVCDFKENEAERGCALANAAVELPDKDHPARLVIRAAKSAHHQRFVGLCRDAGLNDPEGLADETQLLWEGARVIAQSVGAEGLSARLIGMLEALGAAHTPTGERGDQHSRSAEGPLVTSDAAR